MTSALLEIDFQPWILQMAHDPEVLSRAADVRRRYLSEDTKLFALRYRSMDPSDPLRFDLDGQGACFLPGMLPTADSVVLSKTGRDPFDNPDLLSNLRCRSVTKTVIYGLLTDGGVQEAAFSAASHGFEVEVIADACAGSSAQAHQAALRRLAGTVKVV